MSGTTRRKIVLMVIAEVICLAALAVFLIGLQTVLSADTQEREMAQKLSQLRQSLENSIGIADDNTESFDNENVTKAAMLAYCVSRDILPDLERDTLDTFRDQMGVTNVLIVDRWGEVLAQAQPSPANFTRARFNQLRQAFLRRRDNLYAEGVYTSDPFEVTYPSGVTYRYYGARIDRDRLAVVEQNTAERDALVANSTVWSSLLNNVSVGTDGYCFVVTSRECIFRYHPDPEMIGKDALYAGVDMNELEDGNCAWMRINGQRLYCGVIRLEDYYVICAITEDEFNSFGSFTVVLVLISFFVVITTIIDYIILTRAARERRYGIERKNEQDFVTVFGLRYHRRNMTRMLACSLVGLLFVFSISYYMQTLFSLSSTSMNNEYRLDEVQDALTRYQQNVDAVMEDYNQNALVRAKLAAYILQNNPELATDAELHVISEVLGVQYTAVFDDKARIVATDSGYKGFTLSKDPDDQSYAFWRLLQGVDSYVQEATTDDVGVYRQYAGCTLRNAENVPAGFVQIAIDPALLAQATKNLNIASVLQGIRAGQTGFAFAVDRDTGKFVYYPDSRMMDRNASEFGLDLERFSGSEAGYATLDGVDYFLSLMETADYQVFIAMPVKEMSNDRLLLALASAAFCLVCLLLVCLLNFEEDSPGLQNAFWRRLKLPSGDKGPGLLKKFDDAWARKMRIDARSPGQHVLGLLKTLIACVAVFIAIATLFADKLFSENSVLRYVLSGHWQHGFNIFAVTAALMEISMLLMVGIIIHGVLGLCRIIANTRGDTVCTLLGHMVNAGLVLMAVYHCLSLFGVDTATLVASAGIASMVIGLAAQGTLNDVLGGLLILFDGKFQVGDIVNIGGWRGVVREVGLRSTLVEDFGGNFKSINNRDVTNVINLSRKQSRIEVSVMVHPGEPLACVEEVLDRELPTLRAKLPAIRKGPTYLGVSAMTLTGMELRVSANCDEADCDVLTRQLLRELKLIFDRNGIATAAAPIRPTSARTEAINAAEKAAEKGAGKAGADTKEPAGAV